jgi:hypothetical protein
VSCLGKKLPLFGYTQQQQPIKQKKRKNGSQQKGNGKEVQE